MNTLLAKPFLTPLGSKQADSASSYASSEKLGLQKLDEPVAAFERVVARQGCEVRFDIQWGIGCRAGIPRHTGYKRSK